MAASDSAGDDSLYPIAVLIDELKNEDVQVSFGSLSIYPPEGNGFGVRAHAFPYFNRRGGGASAGLTQQYAEWVMSFGFGGIEEFLAFSLTRVPCHFESIQYSLIISLFLLSYTKKYTL